MTQIIISTIIGNCNRSFNDFERTYGTRHSLTILHYISRFLEPAGRPSTAHKQLQGQSDSFLPRDAMHSADYAMARCLSVCHTLVLCLNGYTYPHSSNVFNRRVTGLLHHSIIFIPNGMALFQQRPLTEASNAREYEKARFSTIALSRKWYKIEPQLLQITRRKPYALCRLLALLIILSDLLK